MPKQKDLVGVKSGHLVVLTYAGRYKHGGSQWLCKCSLCGKEVILKAQCIARGQKTCSTKCGVSESNAKRSTHGMWRTPEYNAWVSIKERCLNPNTKHYHRYGGRGIQICEEWKNDFQSFYEHVGARPTAKHSMERIYNDKGYEPGNVRWATKKEQARNRCDNVLYTHNGETKTLIEWAEFYDINYNTVVGRRFKGVEGEALFAKRRLSYGCIKKWKQKQ